LELTHAYHHLIHQAKFRKEWTSYLKTFVGRPTPLMVCGAAQAAVDAAHLFKARRSVPYRAHKINNALGQVLLAKHLG